MVKLDSISFLDHVRLKNGVEESKNFFNKLAKENKKAAISLINDDSLYYGSLFILKREIEEFNLYKDLSLRNKIALCITREILQRERIDYSKEYTSSDYVQIVYSILNWMLKTGALDDGLNDEYDEVLDITSILLIKVYRDKKLLPIIADMIFKRYSRGFFIHDLVWAFFQGKDPYSFIAVAKYLNSTDSKEVELARKLLSFVPSLEKGNMAVFLNWLEENHSFLYFKEESFQKGSNPKPYVVILEGKYLCTPVSINTGEIIKPLEDREQKLLGEFKKLSYSKKALLSNFSWKLHHQNMNWWNGWINLSVKEQIGVMRVGGLR